MAYRDGIVNKNNTTNFPACDRLRRIALLDKQGVLIGYDLRWCEPGRSWGPREVPVPIECDLKPHAYRWDPTLRHFRPIGPVPYPPIVITGPGATPAARIKLLLALRKLHSRNPDWLSWQFRAFLEGLFGFKE